MILGSNGATMRGSNLKRIVLPLLLLLSFVVPLPTVDAQTSRRRRTRRAKTVAGVVLGKNKATLKSGYKLVKDGESRALVYRTDAQIAGSPAAGLTGVLACGCSFYSTGCEFVIDDTNGSARCTGCLKCFMYITNVPSAPGVRTTR